MFRTKYVETIKTHILCSVTVFQKSFHLRDNVKKYCRGGAGNTVPSVSSLLCALSCIADVSMYFNVP